MLFEQQKRDRFMQIPEGRQYRIRRLIYRSSYTGTRETDGILGAFARAWLHRMDDETLDDFEALLDCGDPAIWGWVSGQAEVPANFQNRALDILCHWVSTEFPACAAPIEGR